MKKLFTIGEFAKLTFVSSHTLRYYDKIGLLKPRQVGKTNRYRYYTYEDFLFMDTIKYLKKIGMPLEEIQRHFAKRTLDETLALYKRQLAEAEQRIRELNFIRAHIQRNIGYLEKGRQIKGFDAPCLMEFARSAALVVRGGSTDGGEMGNPFDTQSPYNMLFCSVAEQLYREDLRTMGNALAVKAKEDILQGIFTNTVGVGCMLLEDSAELPESIKLERIPAGMYGCICHVGSVGKIGTSYERLLHYLAEEGFELTGESYELFLVDSVDTAVEAEYVTEIRIPVRTGNGRR